MNFKHSWTRRLKYVFPIMMMLGTLFGLKTANVFAEKVIVDPSNPIQNVKNNFIIPKDVPNAKTNITVNGASKVYKYHVDANKGGFTDDYVGLVEGNKNIRYPSFQKEYGETNLVLEGVTTNTKVNIDYGKIGTYNGKKVNIKLVLSNIHLYSDTLPWNLLDNNYTKTHFRDDGYKNTNGAMSKSKKRTVLWISDNLFSGIVYHSTQMNVQLVATYEDGSPVQFSGDTFISFNSLNPAGGKSTDLKGEYAHYDKMNTTDWYVRQDAVLSEFKSFYNNLNVVGGHPGGSSKLTQADNDFNNLHDKLGDPKFGQGTVSFKISEANPTFVIGSSNVQTWFTLSSATIFSVVPDQPEKTGVDKNGNNVNDKMLQVGDTIQYRIKQKVNRLGVDLLAVYDRFELIDNLPKEVNYVDAHVESGTNKKFDVSGEVTYDKTKHQVKYAAKADTLKNRMKYNGETYELVINVKVNELANQNSVAKNQGTSIINKVEKDTNIITVYFPKIPVKEVQQNGKDVNGRNDGKKGTPTAPLNAGSEVQYLVTQKWHTKGVDAASDHYKQFSIQDPIEARLTYKEGSAQVIDKSKGKDITSEGTLTYDSNSRTLKWEASADFLSNNLLDGREIQLIFTAKTPLQSEKNIDNQAVVAVDNVSNKTNVVTIGVDPNLPQVIVPKTGSTHLVTISAVSLLLLVLATFSYAVLRYI
ncbi:TPA: isopeptide-forming domain-containing fimbrial protein [Enterococcus faecium]|uniref:isopeptide-forming domain-containing fimbrial protein n=1 Tax=Enterococcus faecium TaxID=1352 RepID=UPI0014612E19|nr:isopeptide-forming domain-containing fimbrial protein [Enterococcus faecium]MBH1295295.1 isopeptide-forming domain-containing fimbrial protein [Enterococcus faecium]NMQ70305.1 isopeptide-forming domain-containing fimbrial protein [Enterococcus faecium]HAQ6871915.1 isopeptide-forming domain-containing fimbrial protein [Enterococcus faecium]HAQ7537157.1 isopeptide-forming domain-containing fimbrial protein [Enterococcus faecium]HAQ7868797.1 isopeptide-forming domain-containing fimbrial protei